MPSLKQRSSEIVEPLNSENRWPAYAENKVLAPSEVAERAEALRLSGASIATLNGSFDLLHAGHLWILEEASQQADLLLVALNSDDSIRSYKSPNRPIIPLRERILMIAALGLVDYVTWFEELDPCQLLERIKPDVHVNCCEYGVNCIEAETVSKNGGRLHLVRRIPGLATSDIIKKVQDLCD